MIQDIEPYQYDNHYYENQGHLDKHDVKNRVYRNMYSVLFCVVSFNKPPAMQVRPQLLQLTAKKGYGS